jgi:hypothetical protein
MALTGMSRMHKVSELWFRGKTTRLAYFAKISRDAAIFAVDGHRSPVLRCILAAPSDNGNQPAIYAGIGETLGELALGAGAAAQR